MEFFNNCTIEGILSGYRLFENVSGPNSKNPGTKYISGNITLEAGEKNFIQVEFPYVSATTSRGNVNPTYTFLSNVLNKSIPTSAEGSAGAPVQVIGSSLAFNEYYDKTTRDLTNTGLCNRGGMINLLRDGLTNPGAIFEADMLITGFFIKEDTNEEGKPYGVAKGYVFGYGGVIHPAELVVEIPGALDYFSGQDISPSNPYFSRVKGYEVNRRIEVKNERSGAFSVDSTSAMRRERKFVMTWTPDYPYPYGDEDYLTNEMVKKMLADYETRRADMKTRGIERQKAAEANVAPSVAAMPSNANPAWNAQPTAPTTTPPAGWNAQPTSAAPTGWTPPSTTGGAPAGGWNNGF